MKPHNVSVRTIDTTPIMIFAMFDFGLNKENIKSTNIYPNNANHITEAPAPAVFVKQFGIAHNIEKIPISPNKLIEPVFLSI